VPRARPIFPIAVSIQAASDALDIPLSVVNRTVRTGELAAYRGAGGRIRIATVDLVAWVKSWPRATKQTRNETHAMEAGR
jgi:hypothetical protein